MVIGQKDMKTESIDGHQAESRSLVIRLRLCHYPSILSILGAHLGRQLDILALCYSPLTLIQILVHDSRLITCFICMRLSVYCYLYAFITDWTQLQLPQVQ